MSRPFVYFSDAVLTPMSAVRIIERAAQRIGARPMLDPAALWTHTALSVSSQARLYGMRGYRRDNFQRWLTGCASAIVDNHSLHGQLEPNSDPLAVDDRSADMDGFRTELVRRLYQPEAYSVAADVREFVADLDAAGIGWGVLANTPPIYGAVLDHLGLKPNGPLLEATGSDMFKPLPIMWRRAARKAPADARHNVWFVGAAAHPCDNTATTSVRTALLAPQLTHSDALGAHFRVASIDDLRPHLLPRQAFTFQPEPPRPPEPVGPLPPLRVPPRLEKEAGLADLKPSRSDDPQ